MTHSILTIRIHAGPFAWHSLSQKPTSSRRAAKTCLPKRLEIALVASVRIKMGDDLFIDNFVLALDVLKTYRAFGRSIQRTRSFQLNTALHNTRSPDYISFCGRFWTWNRWEDDTLCPWMCWIVYVEWRWMVLTNICTTSSYFIRVSGPGLPSRVLVCDNIQKVTRWNIHDTKTCRDVPKENCYFCEALAHP